MYQIPRSIYCWSLVSTTWPPQCQWLVFCKISTVYSQMVQNRTGTKWGKQRPAPQGRVNCCRPFLKGGPINGLNFNYFSPLLHFCASNNKLSMNVWKKMMVTLLLKIVSKFQKIRNNSAYSDFCPTFFVWPVCLEQYATGGKNY